MISFLASMIQSDFNVDLLETDGVYEFLGKRRVDVWHFIIAFDKHNDGDNYHNINIRQFHIPRWHVAKALKWLINEASSNGFDQWLSIWENCSIKFSSSDKIEIMFEDHEFMLPQTIISSILEDIQQIAKSDVSIKAIDDKFILPADKTHNGNPIVHASFDLISAIAYEKDVRGRLDAEDFAIYSAFCTMTDFETSTNIPIETLKEAIELQYKYVSPEMLPEDVLYSISAMQDMLFSKHIYGTGIQAPPHDSLEILVAGINKLNKSQCAQFTLLSGMYNLGIMAVLSTILGFMSYERYVEIKTEGFTPDSNDEQFIRHSIPFINLLGQLGQS